MAENSSTKKVANSLVVVSSAAVLAVYAAGYVRTRSAAERFETQAAEWRPAISVPLRTESPIAEFRPAAPGGPATRASRAAVSAPPIPTDGAAENSNLITSAEPEPAKANVPEGAAAPPSGETASVANQASEPAPAAAQQAEPSAATLLPPVQAAPEWRDGMYYGWGTSRHGNIQAEVVIERGRIASATIAQCLTRYSCSVIANLPPQVAQRQNAEVDYVSGATQSANAFHWAVVDALSKAK